MEKLGFTRDDLALFSDGDPEARERRLRERLRPRLEEIAFRFAPPLSRLAGLPLAAVIQVPRPSGTQAEAFASFVESGGDTLQEPYFTLAVNRGGVHARLVIERQAAEKSRLAQKVSKAAALLAREFGEIELRCYDDWGGRGLPAPASAARAPFWKDIAGRLAKAAGSLDIGVGWPEARAVLLAYEDLLPAYRTLAPLYRRLHADG